MNDPLKKFNLLGNDTASSEVKILHFEKEIISPGYKKPTVEITVGVVTSREILLCGRRCGLVVIIRRLLRLVNKFFLLFLPAANKPPDGSSCDYDASNDKL